MVASIQAAGASSVAPSAVTSPSCGASPEARLLALMVYTQLVQGESAQTSVKLSEQELKDLRAAVREAIEEASEANEDSGFWGDIGDVLGGDIATLAQVVAIAAACVVTGGAAAIVLGAIAIGCSLASKYADELGLPPEVAMGIGIAAAVASVAAGNVGGAASAVGTASTAARVGGAAAQGATQASQLAQIAAQVKVAATIVASSAQAGGAVANIASGYYASEAIDHKATAQEAQSKSTLESLSIDDAIDLLEQAVERQTAACEITTDISQAKQRSSELIILSFSGAA